jgi:hypothetical protein
MYSRICPWLLTWPDYEEEFDVEEGYNNDMRTRTFSSQLPVWLRLDLGPTMLLFSSADYYVELRLRGIIVILGHVAIIVSCLNSVVWML